MWILEIIITLAIVFSGICALYFYHKESTPGGLLGTLEKDVEKEPLDSTRVKWWDENGEDN